MAVRITSFAPTFRPILGVHIFRKFRIFRNSIQQMLKLCIWKCQNWKVIAFEIFFFEIFENFEKFFEKKSWFWHDDAAKC